MTGIKDLICKGINKQIDQVIFKNKDGLISRSLVNDSHSFYKIQTTNNTKNSAVDQKTSQIMLVKDNRLEDLKDMCLEKV